MRRALGLLAMLGALSVTPLAWAQERDPAAAQALFDKGVELLKQEKWSEACPQFEASMKLDPSVGTQVNIARCLEHDGLIARAWAEFKRAKALNQETPGAKRKKGVDAFVDEAIARLEPRLPWITLRLASTPPGVRVARDGVELPLEGLGQKMPLDPGKHTFEVSAPGFTTETRSLDAKEGEALELTVELKPAPEPAVEPPGLPPTVPTPPTPQPAPVPGAAPAGGPSALLVAGGVLSGVGALTLAVSAITGGLAASDRGTLDDLVASETCSESGAVITCDSSEARAAAQEAIDRGQPLALTSTATLFAGAAIAATGLTLIIVGATQAPGSRPQVGVAPLLWSGGGGVSLGGRF